ncbi:MAG TPA: CaiB/BaiF CoA-transferase family protein [Terriglobales bacterium]|nr:CaiB/BaiF CoA-transferase family protein [Terriglobales bacterium]
MSGALEGLRIADFSQLVQGPNATQMLADMGADVVKIEPLHGDWQRNWSLKDAYIDGESVSFLTFNRGKRSIALNLKHPLGKEAALKIVQSSDVLLENFRPGVMDRLGLGYQFLSSVHPKLIYCASCGWGQDGPYVTRPGQDLLAQAMAGVLYLNGKAGDPPSPVGMGIADLTASFHIVSAILAAVYHRNRSGEGQRIDINLLNSILSLATQEVTLYFNTHSEPERSAAGIGHPCVGAPMGVYRTRDGYIVVAMMPIGKVAELVGIEGFGDNDSRNLLENRDEVKRKLEPGFARKTTAELMEMFMEADIWAAPVNSFPALEGDPQVRHNQIVVSFEHPKAKQFRTIGPPIRFSRTPSSIKRPPLLGEHSRQILREIGYPDSDIERLVRDGVIAQDAG